MHHEPAHAHLAKNARLPEQLFLVEPVIPCPKWFPAKRRRRVCENVMEGSCGFSVWNGHGSRKSDAFGDRRKREENFERSWKLPAGSTIPVLQCTKVASMEPPKPASNLTLEPGVVYIVRQLFTDYRGCTFEPGRLLTYEGRSYFAYHGGHTLIFRETTIALQEDEQIEILGSLGDFLVIHDESGRRPPPVMERMRTAAKSSGLALIVNLAFVAASAWLIYLDARNWKWASFGILFFGFCAAMEILEMRRRDRP
jgi:hypothetical protein